MAVSVSQVLNDARRLVTRMKEYDVSTDNLLIQAQTLNKSVETMREVSTSLNS